ncbi:GNAT family N-acetyltransferase [Methyloligella solikamskensis]|uniref:GNAT family N-acetyltransferase n=1 Tax=Methyloligella solikamskensis TaxID=1177756 RepID=A0ABW3JBP4_9HYPH
MTTDPTSKTTFRPGTQNDSSALAILIDIAGEGIPSALWRGMKEPEQSVLEFGRFRARREEGEFSYRNAVMAEVDGEVAAALVGFQLDDPYDMGNLDEVPDFIRPLVLLEAKAPGSWYVNILACFAEFRRRGLGEALLAIAEERAREASAPALSVIVGSWNENAARLYARAGYAEAAREKAPSPEGDDRGEWILMVKPLR